MPPAPSAKVLVAEQGGSGKQHFSIDVAFPVYAIAFTDNRTVVLGGGGGSSRTGVKNRLVRRFPFGWRVLEEALLHAAVLHAVYVKGS